VITAQTVTEVAVVVFHKLCRIVRFSSVYKTESVSMSNCSSTGSGSKSSDTA